MFCPSCGKDNGQGLTYCRFCGQALTPLPGTPTASPASASPAPASYAAARVVGPPVPRINVFAALAILAFLAFAVFLAATYPVPQDGTPVEAFRVGVFLGTCVIPFIVAYIAGGMKRRRNPNRFAMVFALVGFGLGGLSWAGANMDRVASLFSHENPEQRVGRLMREASGAQPVRNSFFSSDRQFDDHMRKQFRNIFRVNQEFMARINQLDTNEIGKVATPQSFVDPQYAAEGIRQVHASYELDNALEHKVEEIASNIRQTFQNTSWSTTEREAALRGFDRGFADALEKRKQLINAERAYIDATDDIYNYATDHHAEFQLVNGQLMINDPYVVQNFNAKIEQYNARRTDLLRAKENFDRFQKGMFNKMGVSPKDVGLQ